MAANAQGAPVPTTTAAPTVSAAGTATQQTTTAAAAAGTQLPKVSPKDSQVIATILKDMGINDYEPRVIHQLLEFSYRYVTNVLEDAQNLSQYCNKKTIDSEDVKLAVGLQVDKMFTSPPPREVVAEMSRNKNATPLPPIKSNTGPRLPAERYSMIGCNYKLRSKPNANGSGGNQQGGSGINLPYRTNPTSTLMTVGRPGTLTVGSVGMKRKNDEQ